MFQGAQVATAVAAPAEGNLPWKCDSKQSREPRARMARPGVLVAKECRKMQLYGRMKEQELRRRGLDVDADYDWL